MLINKGTYLLFALLLACSAGIGQTMTFTMSPIAITNGSVSVIGGNPIGVDGKSKCLNVSSGLGSLMTVNNNHGVFGASCVETPPVATVSVSLSAVKVNVYPNPTHSTSILKCEGQFDANLFGQVRVMSIEGRMMMSQMVAMKDIQAGYTINASSYAAGNYVVTLDVKDQHYSVKLIKL